MRIAAVFIVSIFFYSCASQQESEIIWKSIERDLQSQFILTEDSSVIDLPAGNFMFTKSLMMDGKKDIILRGAGRDSTILSFARQEEGAEGLKISNCVNVVVQDLTIEDAPGDNIKVTDTYGIRFSRVRSRWNGEPKETNGAYAFYPVLSKHVVVEQCIAEGASDAGIYVGQSDSVIIRNNIVYHNVAGIESENSRWVEIYGNKAFDNTGGVLVFDLPGLTQYGHTTRVFDNTIRNNNFRNFAPPGNIVATVPPGTGIMLLATRNIEIFDNEIENNRTMGIGIASYELVKAIEIQEGSQLAENTMIADQDPGYDPFPDDIYIRNNKFSNKHWFPTTSNDFGLLFLSKFPMGTPDIVFDGIVAGDRELKLCLRDNGNAKFANLDAGNEFEGLSTDVAPYRCQMESIKAIYN